MIKRSDIKGFELKIFGYYIEFCFIKFLFNSLMISMMYLMMLEKDTTIKWWKVDKMQIQVFKEMVKIGRGWKMKDLSEQIFEQATLLQKRYMDGFKAGKICSFNALRVKLDKIFDDFTPTNVLSLKDTIMLYNRLKKVVYEELLK